MIELLKTAEAHAAEVLTEHKSQVEPLIAESEAMETLRFGEIQALLDPDSKVTQLKPPKTYYDSISPVG